MCSDVDAGNVMLCSGFGQSITATGRRMISAWCVRCVVRCAQILRSYRTISTSGILESSSTTINTILTFTKKYIFNCALCKTPLNIFNLQKQIYIKIQEQETVYILNNKNDSFQKHWLRFEKLFNIFLMGTRLSGFGLWGAMLDTGCSCYHIEYLIARHMFIIFLIFFSSSNDLCCKWGTIASCY